MTTGHFATVCWRLAPSTIERLAEGLHQADYRSEVVGDHTTCVLLELT